MERWAILSQLLTKNSRGASVAALQSLSERLSGEKDLDWVQGFLCPVKGKCILLKNSMTTGKIRGFIILESDQESWGNKTLRRSFDLKNKHEGNAELPAETQTLQCELCRQQQAEVAPGEGWSCQGHIYTQGLGNTAQESQSLVLLPRGMRMPGKGRSSSPSVAPHGDFFIYWFLYLCWRRADPNLDLRKAFRKRCNIQEEKAFESYILNSLSCKY